MREIGLAIQDATILERASITKPSAGRVMLSSHIKRCKTGTRSQRDPKWAGDELVADSERE